MHALLRTLLLIEVKSDLTSIEETIRRLDVKTRLARQVIGPELGWRPDRVATILVLPETTAARTIVATHAAIFRSRSLLEGEKFDDG